MDLLNMVENYKKVNEEARKVTYETMRTLRTLFVDLPFEMKQVEVQEPAVWDSRQQVTRKIYYPVLSVPEGYNKVQEEYERRGGNGFNHKYLLTSEAGPQVVVSENTHFIYYFRNSSKGIINFPFNIVDSEVFYKLTIEGEDYKFTRTFEDEEMLEMISGKELEKATSSFPRCKEYSYQKSEKEYTEFLTAIGVTEIAFPLSKLVHSKCNEITLNPWFKAQIEILFDEEAISTWFEDEFWNTRIENMLYSRVTVNMKLYAGGVNITSKSFKWYEVKDKKYKKGITFQEAIELIKE